MSARRQLIRFAGVGLATNALLYLAYLAITAVGAGHKSAMTGLYCTGVALTFAVNRNWTFAHDGALSAPWRRYCALYAAGYLVNLLLLFALVDIAGLGHQPVQAALIVLVALLTFLGQKHWVFRR